MALKIWPVAYGKILSAEQLSYMLDLFYSPASLRKQMDQLKHSFLIAENEDGIPVGFSSFSAHQENQTTFHLHKLYVLPDNQKSHLGQQLLEATSSAVKSLHGRYLHLNVNRSNAAINFYLKMGFIIIREEDNDIGHGFFMNDYVMEKKL